jgi:hypothetical protein
MAGGMGVCGGVSAASLEIRRLDAMLDAMLDL